MASCACEPSGGKAPLLSSNAGGASPTSAPGGNGALPQWCDQRNAAEEQTFRATLTRRLGHRRWASRLCGCGPGLGLHLAQARRAPPSSPWSDLCRMRAHLNSRGGAGAPIMRPLPGAAPLRAPGRALIGRGCGGAELALCHRQPTRIRCRSRFKRSNNFLAKSVRSNLHFFTGET